MRAVVRAVGSEVKTVKPGDHVVSCLSAFCGHCEFCVTGRMALCLGGDTRRAQTAAPRITRNGGEPVAQMLNLSAFADQMLIHEHACVAIDKDMPLDRAAVIGCAVTTGAGAIFNACSVVPGETVAVIGGGNSGVEAAIDLAGIVAHVTLLEFGEDLRADAVLQRKLNSLPNVRVLKMAQTTEVKGDGQKVTGLIYKDRSSEEMHSVELEGIFVQIGLLPNSEWLKGTLELSRFGEIIVDAKGQTSIPGVFAAGDVTTVPYKQIVIAMGAGSTQAMRQVVLQSMSHRRRDWLVLELH